MKFGRLTLSPADLARALNLPEGDAIVGAAMTGPEEVSVFVTGARFQESAPVIATGAGPAFESPPSESLADYLKV